MRQLCALVLLIVLGGTAHAHERNKAKKATSDVQLGEVLDVTCFLDHESKGEKHASCAQKCIADSNPVAILSKG